MLAALGWQVFPLHSPKGEYCDCGDGPKCASPAKHPRTRNGLKDATTDIELIERWWSQWPHANIAIATGKASGLVVMDVDPRHEGDVALNALLEERGLLPAGPAAFTGGGGWHYYYRHPGHHVPSRSAILGAGIDIKADGGYVVAPPSVHITGVTYEWSKNGLDVEVPAMPSWMHEMAIAKQDRQYAVEPESAIPQGQRNQYLTSLGGSMRRRGMSQAAIFAALMAENEERCQPALERNEVAQIAASVARYEPSEAVPIISAATEQTPRGERMTRAPGAQERPHVEPRTVTLREIQSKTYPPPKWAVPGMMPVGLTLLAGRSKMGKSWMMMGVAIAIAEGGIAFGMTPVEDGDVLYIAYEDYERRWQDRGKTLLGDVQWPERLHIAPTGCWPQRNDGGLEAIDSWLGQYPQARLVVMDTLQRFRGADISEGDKSAFSADYKVSGDLQELALKHDVAIAVVHHFRKSLSEVDWVDQINGTNGIAAAADVIWGFVRERGDNQSATLKTTGRDVLEEELALSWDTAKLGWFVSGTAEEVQGSAEAKEFNEALWELGHGANVHYRKVAEHTAKQAKTVLQMARRLTKRGQIIAVGDGYYRPLPAGGVAVTAVTEAENRYENAVTPPLSPTSHPKSPVTGGDRPVTAPLSPDFESKNGGGDSGDRKIAAFVGGTQQPDQPCPTCDEHNWLRRAAGGWVCGTCKPWETRA